MQNDSKSVSHGRHFLRRSDAATYITERYGFPCSRSNAELMSLSCWIYFWQRGK